MKKVILLTVALVIDWLSVAMAQVWVNPQEFTHLECTPSERLKV